MNDNPPPSYYEPPDLEADYRHQQCEHPEYDDKLCKWDESNDCQYCHRPGPYCVCP